MNVCCVNEAAREHGLGEQRNADGFGGDIRVLNGVGAVGEEQVK